MPIDAQFHFARLKGGARKRMPELRQELEAGFAPRLSETGIEIWGVWASGGMFGVGSNELLVVTSAGSDRDMLGGVQDAVNAWDEVDIVDEHLIAPTVRPIDTARPTRDGLYVFRYFDTLRSDIDDFVRLSDEWWVTFEHDDEYNAEIQGLFVKDDPDPERTSMLLVTWYGTLASWQRSRQPSEDEGARSVIRERGEITLASIGYATILLAP